MEKLTSHRVTPWGAVLPRSVLDDALSAVAEMVVYDLGENEYVFPYAARYMKGMVAACGKLIDDEQVELVNGEPATSYGQLALQASRPMLVELDNTRLEPAGFDVSGAVFANKAMQATNQAFLLHYMRVIAPPAPGA